MKGVDRRIYDSPSARRPIWIGAYLALRQCSDSPTVLRDHPDSVQALRPPVGERDPFPLWRPGGRDQRAGDLALVGGDQSAVRPIGPGDVDLRQAAPLAKRKGDLASAGRPGGVGAAVYDLVKARAVGADDIDAVRSVPERD